MILTEVVDEETYQLTQAIANYLGSTKERVLRVAVALLAVDCGLKFELPRKEKEHAG